jgi:ATPase subunit of ABC transporter with duplicated ATPase domains
VKIGQLDQDRRSANTGQTVLEVFIAATRLTVGQARTLLAKFGIGPDHVSRPAGSMSSGERTRVELAKFQATGVNFLVLDEPTNHLDLPAIEQLENALERFDGTFLLVSHDRRMLEAVAVNRRLEIGRSGHVKLSSQ